MEDNTNKFIQNQKFMWNDLSALSERVDSIDDKLLTIIHQNASFERKLDRLLQSRKTNSSSTPKQRKKKTKVQGKSKDWAHLLHLPTALQENITKFTAELIFSASEFPDQLISDGCLNEDDCQKICSMPSTVDQVRLLIRKIKGRGPETVQKFLDIIKSEYPALVTAVEETFKQKVEQSKIKPHCAYCLIRKTVDLKDIADSLWASSLITDEIYSSIIEADTTNMQLKWSYVIYSINNAKDPDAAKQVLEGSLKEKYEHLVQPFIEHRNRTTQLSCKCSAKRSFRMRNASVGSQTDMSTYSGYQNTCPNLNLLESETGSEDCFSAVDSLDLVKGFYSDVKQFDDGCQVSIEGKAPVTDAPVSPDTTTQDCDILLQAQANQMPRSRHTSGKFQPEGNEQLEDGHVTSLPYVTNGDDKSSPETATDDNRPDFARSISNTTIIPKPNNGPKQSSSSADDTLIRSSDATVSPETEKILQLSSENHNKLTKSSSASPEQKVSTPQVVIPKLKLRRRRRPKYRLEHEDSSSCPEDEDEKPSYSRTRHKTAGKKVLHRLQSAPAEIVLTESRHITDSTVGTRITTQRRRKETEKRANRRLRANQRKEKKEAHEDTTHKVLRPNVSTEGHVPSSPYNPSWGHRPQDRNTVHWDHNQARRFWRMSQLYAASEFKTQVYSDSDLQTEVSDVHDLTDCTV